MTGKHRVVIIGAGPSGLAAAMELHKAGGDFVVFEKEEKIGGLAKTITVQEEDLIFRTDMGPHRFFSKNQYLYDFIEDLLEEKWIRVKRQTRQYINGQFFDYPVKALQVIKNLGVAKVTKVFWDYFLAIVKYKFFRKRFEHFGDFAEANFGRTLANLNVVGYNEKIWGISVSELHTDWANQRVRGLSVSALLKEALHKLFGSKEAELKTLVDQFYYPEFGTGTIYEAIREQIENGDDRILTQSFPVRVSHYGDKITGVEISVNGSIQTVGLDYLVESIHLDDFVKLLDPLPPQEVLDAASRLNYRSVVFLFLTLNKQRVFDDQWVYFPDPDVPFARMSEMKNFSKLMSPPGLTSLLIEFFCTPSDRIFLMSESELLELSLPYLEKFGFITSKEIRGAYVFRGNKDYPVYNLTYDQNLKIIKEYLDNFRNLYYIGRPGRFRYTNQDHSLEMGIAAAHSILSGRPADIDRVGSEDEYYEKGSIPSPKTKYEFKYLLKIIKDVLMPTSRPNLFVRYVFFAGLATFVDLGILFLLTEYYNLWYFYAASFSYLAGMITNYLLNKYFNFSNLSREYVKQFMLFAIVALVGLGLNQLLLYVLVEGLNIYYLLAKLIVVAVVMFWSFWGHKRVTFYYFK